MPVCALGENLLIELMLGQRIREWQPWSGAWGRRNPAPAPNPVPRGHAPPRALTSLAGLRREKSRRGQRRCRCPEHQLRMLSHSTVRVGPEPSSRCSSTSCLRARTAVFSSICSSCGIGRAEGHRFPHFCPAQPGSLDTKSHRCTWPTGGQGWGPGLGSLSMACRPGREWAPGRPGPQ